MPGAGVDSRLDGRDRDQTKWNATDRSGRSNRDFELFWQTEYRDVFDELHRLTGWRAFGRPHAEAPSSEPSDEQSEDTDEVTNARP